MVSFYVPPLPDEPDVQVVVKWRSGTASPAEIEAIRKLLPAVRDWPVSQVFEQARSSSGWVLAVAHPVHARQMVQEAERAGLVVAVEPLPAKRD